MTRQARPPYAAGDRPWVLHAGTGGTSLAQLPVARIWPHRGGVPSERWAVELAGPAGPLVVFVDDRGRDRHGYVAPAKRTA